MKALCLVAHPDDCVIFGWGFIKKYQMDWTIAYLTYDNTNSRSIEMQQFWSKHNVQTIHGGFNDDYSMVQNGQLGFDEIDGANFCRTITDKFDFLLTHNHLGEYGHLHHKFINQCIRDMLIPKVYFGNFPEYYNEIITTEPYNVHDLPLHKDVILGFDNSRFKYYITEQAQKTLNERIT